MSVPAAFGGVILIWATTPLAIKWSSEGGHFLFGVSARMLLGLFLCLVLVALLSRRMRWYPAALSTYVAGGLGVWGAMTSVYWGAQYVPSGLISVIFGFSPVVTGLFAHLWLQERAFTAFRSLGMVLGVAGLAVIFRNSLVLGVDALYGVAAVLVSVLIHSASVVAVKRINAGVPALQVTTGSLMVALPLFLLVWAVADGQWPRELPTRAWMAIVYLGVVGSVVGFVLYFYILRALPATRVALLALVSPVLALFIGWAFNGEVIPWETWAGTALILSALAVYQWGDRLWGMGLGAPAGPRLGAPEGARAKD
ncbi:MAG: DMT family transporter [Pseudomonadota bacterium]